MTNKIRCALAVVALIASTAASATTINWGTISNSASRSIGNTFDDRGSFSDRYNFTLAGGASGSGDVDWGSGWFSSLDIDLTSISLYSGSALIGSDSSPAHFSFANLGAGSYSLFVSGNITGRFEFGTAGYDGHIHFSPSATKVPEPGSFVLAALGLLGLAFAMRRRLFKLS